MNIHIAALLTCHNRKDKTLACLEALYSQELPENVRISVYLVDDGCTDGTADAVRGRFQKINILQGDGSLYWNGGMRLAFNKAMGSNYNYYLWLNDDTLLYSNAVNNLLSTSVALGSEFACTAIICGSTIDPQTHVQTYGGLVRASKWHPLKLRMVTPGKTPKRCITMHGNCVLIPEMVAKIVGNLSAEYRHNFGDNDYGLRAGRLGCSQWIAPGYVGTCVNDHFLRLEYKNISLRERWQKIIGPKGHPPRDWATYCKRYAGPLWFLFWCRPYIKAAIMMLLPVCVY